MYCKIHSKLIQEYNIFKSLQSQLVTSTGYLLDKFIHVLKFNQVSFAVCVNTENIGYNIKYKHKCIG